MARSANYPMLLDETKTIDIATLKQYGFLESEQIRRGVVTWRNNGVKTASISIKVDTFEDFVEFDYKAAEDLITYRVNLIRRTANLGNGVLWLFECPKTHRPCRKLYYSFPYFLHRRAHKGSMYSIQTYSAVTRAKMRLIDDFHGVDKQYQILHSKHFRTHYDGKPTKRYLRAMKAIEKGNRITPETIERLFIL